MLRTMVDAASRPTGVQSLHRALDLIEALAAHGGEAALGDLADSAALPVPTAHRLLHTLVERGYLRRVRARRYGLGYRLIPLGTAAGRLAAGGARQTLAALVDAIGESANLAVLSGDHAEYVAQVPSSHSMRMFTEVGRRVELHCTGVGKAMLAQLSDAQVSAIVRRAGLTAHTPHTHTEESSLLADLARIRERGYALDEQEQELGVRCLAVPVRHPVLTWSAISVSGPLTRMNDAVVARAVPLLVEAAHDLITSSERMDR